MSTYKFDISKRNIAASADSRVPADDSTGLSEPDCNVCVALNGTDQHTATLTDSGVSLTFTTDLAVADHTISIRNVTGNSSTDFTVDNIYVDNKIIVATQFDYNNVVQGGTSTLRQLLSWYKTRAYDGDYNVWFGTIHYPTDSSKEEAGTHYRPIVVGDHQAEWRWYFTKNSNNQLVMTYTGDTHNAEYDSTAQHTYYFAQNPTAVTMVEWGESELQVDDSSTTPFTGAGTYDANLVNVDDDLDEANESASRIVIITWGEYREIKFLKWYHANHDVTAITVS